MIIPELIPISDLRQRQEAVLSRIEDGPVVLTQHGRAAVVLVSPSQWNQLMAEIEDLQDTIDAVEARQEAESSLAFEDYLARRGENVPDSPDE
jgi:prevent-host-death family protein